MIYECNDIVLKIYNSDFDVEYKDDKSPLTIADTKCNEHIKTTTGVPGAAFTERVIKY